MAEFEGKFKLTEEELNTITGGANPDWTLLNEYDQQYYCKSFSGMPGDAGCSIISCCRVCSHRQVEAANYYCDAGKYPNLSPF